MRWGLGETGDKSVDLLFALWLHNSHVKLIMYIAAACSNAVRGGHVPVFGWTGDAQARRTLYSPPIYSV